MRQRYLAAESKPQYLVRAVSIAPGWTLKTLTPVLASLHNSRVLLIQMSVSDQWQQDSERSLHVRHIASVWTKTSHQNIMEIVATGSDSST